MRRLNAHHDRYRHVLYRAPRAGHLAGSLVPNEPTWAGSDLYNLADQRARERLWPRLVAFLGHS
jgi:hypothetical protein